MKKLLAVTVLSAVSLAKPCFGVEWLKDRTFASLSYSTAGAGFDVGYHYTDNVKFSLGSVIKPILDVPTKKVGIGLGFIEKIHYHHKLESTGITPYINVGAGLFEVSPLIQSDEDPQCQITSYFFSYQLGAGINLPLSDRTNVFAGYKVHK